MSECALVLNAGSSSLKFAVIEPATGKNILQGLAERLGTEQASMHYCFNHVNYKHPLKIKSAHAQVIAELVNLIATYALIDNVIVIGHRVVHGGKFTNSVLLDEQTINKLKCNNRLAPLHNAVNLLGIKAAKEHFPTIPQVAVFDTAFHQTLPEYAHIYALPYSLYQKEGIRRYGFHGTSHYYVAKQAALYMEKPAEELSFISAHLGNGCSLCAIKNGKSIDTSMGFTPLSGVVMGTRSGDIDPGLFSFLANELNYSVERIINMLNKESGLLGVSELSNDCRTLVEAMENGHQQATLALTIFCYQIAKTIAAYTVPLGKLDAIIFTGGIGENSAILRKKIIRFLSFFSLELSDDKNAEMIGGKLGEISKNSPIKVLVVPTNEELVIAQDAVAITHQQCKANQGAV